jgi:hypothetical protein
MSPKSTDGKSGASAIPGERNSNIIESPLTHYQREKDKRAARDVPEDELMASARREYKAMLEAQAAKGKGGRPKKKPADAKPESDSDDLPGDE